MKKIHILFPVGILSLVLGFSFVSASNARFVGSISGEDLAVASVQIKNENGVYREGEDIVVKKISSNGTITIENENGTSTKNENKNGTSTKNEEENDLLDSTSTINFEINGDEERSKENRGAIISDAAKVHTGNDFHLFVQSIVNENKNIESVSSQDDRVSVTRNISTKLFGFIPSSIKETVLVVSWGDGTNQVTISRPWWNFLSKDEVATSTTQADVEDKINNIPAVEWKAILDATTKARIISEIQNAFKKTTTQTSPITTVVGAVYNSVFVKNATTFLFIDNNSKTWTVNYQNATFSEISLTTGIVDKTNGLLKTTLKDWIKEQRPVGYIVKDGPGAPGTITIIGTLDASGTLIASDIKVSGQ